MRQKDWGQRLEARTVSSSPVKNRAQASNPRGRSLTKIRKTWEKRKKRSKSCPPSQTLELSAGGDERENGVVNPACETGEVGEEREEGLKEKDRLSKQQPFTGDHEYYPANFQGLRWKNRTNTTNGKVMDTAPATPCISLAKESSEKM